eukprot:Nitzschia sp. Nitz4//scaffold16_size188269//23185//23952//NITZ4_001770-RA/size188269-augustus-gene-0.73-mRNA-1//1//CDS//3329538452//2369//frame0
MTVITDRLRRLPTPPEVGPEGGGNAVLVTNKMCPFAQRVWIGLEAAGIPYTLHEIALYGPNGKPHWFWNLNPKGQVPVIVCPGEHVFVDSDEILDQLEHIASLTSPSGFLFPVDEGVRNHGRTFRSLLEQLLPVAKQAVVGHSNQEQMWDILREMESMVQGPYVCGENVSAADCAAFPFLWRLESEFGPLRKNECPRLGAWLDHCKTNPAFSQTMQKSWWWWW